jgi:hypothetical protein
LDGAAFEQQLERLIESSTFKKDEEIEGQVDMEDSF